MPLACKHALGETASQGTIIDIVSVLGVVRVFQRGSVRLVEAWLGHGTLLLRHDMDEVCCAHAYLRLEL